jgi:hypothetical protein
MFAGRVIPFSVAERNTMLNDWQPALPIADLGEFCQEIGIGKVSRGLLRPRITARQYFSRLISKDKIPDAIRFQAYTVPKREAVWWACLCLRRVSPTLPSKQLKALQAAVRWVLDPSEVNRRAAQAPGQAAGFTTAAGCIAMSVFWSGGSAAPPDQPPAPPDPLITANMVTGAILNIAADDRPEKIKSNFRQCLALGIGVALGKYPWTPEQPPQAHERG